MSSSEHVVCENNLLLLVKNYNCALQTSSLHIMSHCSICWGADLSAKLANLQRFLHSRSRVHFTVLTCVFTALDSHYHTLLSSFRCFINIISPSSLSLSLHILYYIDFPPVQLISLLPMCLSSSLIPWGNVQLYIINLTALPSATMPTCHEVYWSHGCTASAYRARCSRQAVREEPAAPHMPLSVVTLTEYLTKESLRQCVSLSGCI